MKHVVIGTAGHIDHGKTALIKALTGRDTDTLKEEKERNISINLGFTYFDLPSGSRAGIIDVPGHEKFIKNMLAGASGIDIVLLVVSAEEGVMPQTLEHLEILQLLNLKNGIVVFTKIDLVEEEWLDVIKEETKKCFAGTFLEKAPYFFVSSKIGKGLHQLVKKIDEITEGIGEKDRESPFRLPVDRVFSVSGFGTVVTGTILSGSIREGEGVQILPSGILSKIRGIQVYEQKVTQAIAGQRCALNLSNVKVEEISRGCVLSEDGFITPSMRISCSFRCLKSAKKPLQNHQRVWIYHGTAAVIGRVLILDREEVKADETAYIQIRLEKPIAAQRKDRYILRSLSPMITIGGGAIIEPVSVKVKRFDSVWLQELKLKESCCEEAILERIVGDLSYSYPSIKEISRRIGKKEEQIEEKLESLIRHRILIKLNVAEKEIYIHRDFLQDKAEQLDQMLEGFYSENPLKIGIPKEEVKNKIFGETIKQKVYDELLLLLKEEKRIEICNQNVAVCNHKLEYTKMQKRIKDYILEVYKKSEYLPPSIDSLFSKEVDKKIFKMVFDSLIEQGDLVKISENCVFYSEYYEKAKEIIIQHIKKQGSLSIGEAKEILKTSRKYVVCLLEHFDAIKLTKRTEEIRKLY